MEGLWKWSLEETRLLLDSLGAASEAQVSLLMRSGNQPNIHIYLRASRHLSRFGHHRAAERCRRRFKYLKETFFKLRKKFRGDPPPEKKFPFYAEMKALWLRAGRPQRFPSVRQRVVSRRLRELQASRNQQKAPASRPTKEAASGGSEPAEEPDPRTDSAGAQRPSSSVWQRLRERSKRKAPVVLPSEEESESAEDPDPKPDSAGAQGPSPPESPEKVPEEPMPEEDSIVVVEPILGEEIEIVMVEMYFGNKKRSGGGPIKSCVKEGQKFIITFEDEADAQAVLQKKDHVLRNIPLRVSKYRPEIFQDQPQRSSPLVVVENLPGTTAQSTLNQLVGKVSGLSKKDEDFSIEMVPERKAAVISFGKPVGTDQFVKAFNEYYMTKNLKISARVLEATKTIRVENLPPGISGPDIATYFESKKYGGGPVLLTKHIPKENSALLTFANAEVVTTILKQKHYFKSVPVLLCPFYESLGAPLYGKEQPKMPGVSRVSLDPYLLQFLQQDEYLLREIGREMAGCYCEIEWPATDCGSLEITLHPSPALLKQKRSLIKTWNEDVSTRLTSILAKYKVVKCKTDVVVWVAIRKNIMKISDVLVLPDITKETIVLVGRAEAVDRANEELTLLIATAMRDIEREGSVIERNVSVDAGRYSILRKTGLLQRIQLEYPNLYVNYEVSKDCVVLRGAAAEVLKIKNNILESLSRMVQKPVDVHPHVLLFLQRVSEKPLSPLLFWDKNINAVYELVDGKVQLTGETSQDFLSAREEITKELTYKCIAVEDDLVTKMEEWKEMIQNLYKEYNCSNDTIIIHEQKDQVVIAGYSKAVADASQKLSDFVEANTYVQKTIRTKSAAVTMYVEQEKQNNWLSLKEKQVKIHFGTRQNSKQISLAGPRAEVLKALKVFRKILSSLHAISVVVDRPGAKASFREQESVYVIRAKQYFNCLIRIQEGQEDDEEESEDERGFEGRRQCCKSKVRNGVAVTVYREDLTCFVADVVVLPSTEELQHHGALANALLEAAGPELQSECNYVRANKYGNLKPGSAAITSAWNLPYKQVIHVVEPSWHPFRKEKCVEVLKQAVTEILRLAEANRHRSIAIPVISSGFFGFPLKECAHFTVTAIKETIEVPSENRSLKEICLVDFEEDVVQAFSEALDEVFVDAASSSKWPPASKAQKTTAEGKPEHEGAITVGGLKIVIQKKGIEEATTDVIVNTVNKELQLRLDPVSKALLGKAGGGLQKELTTQGQGRALQEGHVLKTRGYGLACFWVLHAILPPWNRGHNSEDKIVGDVVKKCLTITEKLRLNSVAIPAIGTGSLGFPKALVAKLMFDQAFQFSQRRSPGSLQEVHFVLHPTDTDTIQAFTDELNRLKSNRTDVSGSKTLPETSQQQGQAFLGPISSAPGVHKMRIGSLTLQVECGDITRETTDAIVNITNQTFNLRSGASKAVLERAGPEVAKECAQLALLPHNNLICTKGGELPCKNIIHLVCSRDTKAQVSKALLECEKRKLISVAFPAIGTGLAARDEVAVANDMVDAIIDYASNRSAPVVKNIKIIIAQQDLLKVFYESMKRKDVTAAKSELSNVIKGVKEIKIKPDFFLEKTIEPAIFQICGDDKKNVEAAASWMENLILKDQDRINISDQWIADFEESEYKHLGDLQRKLQIQMKVDLEASSPSVHVHGRARDVLFAKAEIQKLIKKVREGYEEQTKADLLRNLVEWQYEESGQYKAFDSLTSMQIEVAAQLQKQLEITIQNKRFKVDPSQQQALDAQGLRVSLRRVSKAEGKIALPKHWEDMRGDRHKLVLLTRTTQEYQDVARKFQQTCPKYKIEKIERVQNPLLWQCYQLKKEDLEKKNGHRNNEKLLFHGTSVSSVISINRNGFSQSYAGLKVGALYGIGTYFATKASYSSEDMYSTPDSEGRKRMYLARVLTGDFCVGSQGLMVAPRKPQSDFERYDSVTDSVSNPSMFVIFSDIQAYPEYLITFRK